MLPQRNLPFRAECDIQLTFFPPLVARAEKKKIKISYSQPRMQQRENFLATFEMATHLFVVSSLHKEKPYSFVFILHLHTPTSTLVAPRVHHIFRHLI